MKTFDQFMNEKYGIDDDVDVLSMYLYKYLKDKPYGKYVFYKNSLPKLNVDIYKIEIEYRYNKIPTTEYDNWFDHSKSRKTNHGYYIFIGLQDMDFRVFHHEVQHVISFIKRGKYIHKSNSVTNTLIINLVNCFYNITWGNDDKQLRYLIYYLYYFDNEEINSLIYEIYGYLKNRKDIKTKEQLLKFLKTGKLEAIETVREMRNYNIRKEISGFDKNLIRGVIYIIYYVLKNSKTSNSYNYDQIFSKIRKKLEPFFKQNKEKLISDEELNKMMNHIEKIIIELGEKLFRKISKIYIILSENLK